MAWKAEQHLIAEGLSDTHTLPEAPEYAVVPPAYAAARRKQSIDAVPILSTRANATPQGHQARCETPGVLAHSDGRRSTNSKRWIAGLDKHP